MPVESKVVPLAGGWQATVAPADKGFPQTVHLILDGGGRSAPYIDAAWKPADPAARRRLERDLGGVLSLSVIEQLAAEIAAWAERAAFNEAELQARQREFAKRGGTAFKTIEMRARLMTQLASEGSVFPVDSVDGALALFKRQGFAPETKLEWPKLNLQQLAVLDIDFHGSSKPRPTTVELDHLGEDLSPSPYLWWRTQGGGIHAVYSIIPNDPYTAEELAVGAAAMVQIDPMVVRCGGTVEVIASTRHPLAMQKGILCGPIHEPGADAVFTCLQRFSAAGATQTEIDDIMEELGYTLGQRLDHGHCLIDPGHVSKSLPVLVGENGLFCYSCAGRDGNGMMSWDYVRQQHGRGVMRRNENGSPIRQAVSRFVHFNHAEYLIGAVAPELHVKFRKALYSALLKRQHKNDHRIEMAFSDFLFVRGKNEWMHADTLLPVGRMLNTADVAVLPSVMELIKAKDGADDELTQKQTLITAHTNDGNLPGWTPIQPLRYIPLFSKFNTPATVEGSVLCRARVSAKGVAYLPHDRRCTLAEAERRIENYFPGISLKYMKALLIAGGCAESGEGPVPILWANGPTGSGKTATIKIVLDMLGEEFKQVSSATEDRLDQMFGEALTVSRYVLFDDFAKKPDDYVRFQAFFTRLSREGFSYHKLHHGLRTLPVNSSLILTDWKTPAAYVNQPQFSRRTHFIRIPSLSHPWDKKETLRLKSWWQKDDLLRNAAESFYSHVVDEYFPEGDDQEFSVKMSRLGVGRLQDEAGDLLEERDILREHVYDLIIGLCSSRPHDSTWKRIGRGYIDIPWREHGQVGAACTALVESLGDAKYNEDNLNHALEQFKLELNKMFPLVRQATLSIKSIASRTYIRLIQDGKDDDGTYRVNAELMTQWPLPANHRDQVLGSLASVSSHLRTQRVQLNGHAVNGHQVNGHNGHHVNGHTNGHGALPTLPGIMPTPQLPTVPPTSWFTFQ